MSRRKTMTEEQMKEIMKEVKRKMSFVDEMEVVPIEVIDQIVGETEIQMNLMKDCRRTI
jgi:hypothetical protein